MALKAMIAKMMVSIMMTWIANCGLLYNMAFAEMPVRSVFMLILVFGCRKIRLNRCVMRDAVHRDFDGAKVLIITAGLNNISLWFLMEKRSGAIVQQMLANGFGHRF
jgi:hypothetical protein